jgi:hypothetical protein
MPPIQRLSIVQIGTVEQPARCLGFFFLANTILTAAHCAVEGEPTIVRIGDGSEMPAGILRSHLIQAFPQFDAMVLGVTVPREWAARIRPIPLLHAQVEPGDYALLLGSSQSDRAMRSFHEVVVRKVDSLQIVVRPVGNRGACRGDSGGPLLLWQAGEVYSAGWLRGGSADCSGADIFVPSASLPM